MSAELGKLGWWDSASVNKYASRNQTVVLPRSDGYTYVIVPEFNAASAFSADISAGDGSNANRLKIFMVNNATGSGLLIFNQAIGFWPTPADMLSADLYNDNSIGVAYLRSDNNNICYRKISVNTWNLSAEETVASPPGTISFVDMSISTGDSPAIAFLQQNNASPKLQVRTFTRSSGGSWSSANTTDLMLGTDPRTSMMGVSIQWIKGGTATARPLAVAASCAQQGGDDKGVQLFTAIVNESTGSLVNWTKRKTYLAGNQTTGWAYLSRRTFLFASGTNELTVAHMEGVDKKNLMIARINFDGSIFTEVIPPQVSVANQGTIDNNSRYTASYANGRVNFYYIATFSGIKSAINFIGIIDSSAKSVRYSGPFKWDNLENAVNDRMYPMAGTGKNASSAAQNSMVYFNKSNAGVFSARFHMVFAPPAPKEVTPGGGTTAITGTPTLGMKIRIGKAYGQSKYKGVWQFATDAAFTTSLRTYVQPDTKFIQVENTAPSAAFVAISDTLPTDMALTSGNWYVRGAVIDEYGNQGPWLNAGTSGGPSTSVQHPPTATDMSPNSGAMVPDGAVTFIWKFNDPLETDTQSAFRVVVERNDTGAVVYDSGKVGSSSQQHLAALDAIALAGVALRWKVILWDADDTMGPDSAYQTFGIAGPPSVIINSPVDGSVASSGTPQILFTPTVDGGRKIKAYEVVVLQNNTPVKLSGRIAIDVDSGTQLAYRIEEPLLDNGAYSVVVSVIDQTAMIGTDQNNFTITVVPAPTPVGVAASAANFGVEGAGYNLVTWSDANRDVDFESWIIERRDDMLSYGTTVVETGTWKQIAEISTTGLSYSYRDYYAPSAYKVNYRVRQLVNRNGDRAMSTGEPVSIAYPMSEGYWIIDPSDEAGVISAFRLANVTADSYSPEVEQAEYVIVGWGRHVDQGDYLGVKGTLSAQLRNGGTTTARQKKRQLENAQKTESLLYLRNPFGDVYPVNVGNLSISRVAGVGRDEFVDVEIPYSEVGSD